MIRKLSLKLLMLGGLCLAGETDVQAQRSFLGRRLDAIKNNKVAAASLTALLAVLFFGGMKIKRDKKVIDKHSFIDAERVVQLWASKASQEVLLAAVEEQILGGRPTRGARELGFVARLARLNCFDSRERVYVQLKDMLEQLNSGINLRQDYIRQPRPLEILMAEFKDSGHMTVELQASLERHQTEQGHYLSRSVYFSQALGHCLSSRDSLLGGQPLPAPEVVCAGRVEVEDLLPRLASAKVLLAQLNRLSRSVEENLTRIQADVSTSEINLTVKNCLRQRAESDKVLLAEFEKKIEDLGAEVFRVVRHAEDFRTHDLSGLRAE